MLKIGLKLANSDRTTCINTIQTILMVGVLLCKLWSSDDAILMQYCKMKESVKMPKIYILTEFLTHAHLSYIKKFLI